MVRRGLVGPVDGSPGSGTLREFAIGAVRQHFTRTLARTPPADFRMPTDEELDALEAFQLSLGRQQELSLPLPLKGTVAALGQDIFLDNDVGKCNRCHFNAGANVPFGGVFNQNFNTGVEDQFDTPADETGELVPPDDGFGNPGDGTFNTPTLVEAADTGPFFHDNSVETIEAAVAFYAGPAFNNSPAGGPPVNGIALDGTQVAAVGAFLRVINALENIRAARVEEGRALRAAKRFVAAKFLRIAFAENEDAVEVLDGGGLHPVAQALLRKAGQLLKSAIGIKTADKRNDVIKKAIALQRKARNRMID